MTTIEAASPVTQDAQVFEYTKAANPIAAGITPAIPFASFRST